MNRSGSCCLVCGCVEVVKDKGFFYCLECQTQREGLRDQFYDDGDCEAEDDEILDLSQELPFFGRVKKKKKRSSIKRGDDFTSWEIFNFVLRGQVEELVALGAPSSFKMTLLQLWSYYLHKLEAAFVSKDERALPKLSLCYTQRDAELVYGVKKKTKQQEKVKPKTIMNLNSSVSESQDWSSSIVKKRLKLQRKKAMMAELTEVSVLGSLGCETCTLDESGIKDPALTIDEAENLFEDSGEDVAVESRDIQLNSVAQNYLERNNRMPRHKTPLHISRQKLIMLLYLGLLYEGADIHLSDVIRWIREGHLSFYDVAHFLPENCFLEGVIYRSFPLTVILPPYGSFLQTTSDLATFLDVVYWPEPDVKKIAEKFIKELQLPKMFCDLILEVFHLASKSFSFVAAKGVLPNYEGRVLAVLLIIMKLLFGLDGKTEHKLSEAASTLNKWLHHKKDKKRKKLFVWNDWVKQIICRNAVLTKHHFPTKHFICPETHGNPESFINSWMKQNEARKDSKYKYRTGPCFFRDKEPALLNFFNNVLQKLEGADHNKNDIDFPPSCTPYNLYTKKILEKCSNNYSLVPPEAQIILSEDFTVCDINYLLAPSMMSKVAEKNEYCLKVITKSAQKTFCPYKRERSSIREGLIMRSSKCNIAVTNCHKRDLNKDNALGGKSFIDHYDERRSNTAKSIQELLNRARMALTSTKRKRKKTGSGSKVKKRKKNVQKKKSKTLKLYTPFTDYWVLHDMDYSISLEDFESKIIFKFPFAFCWLLSECAFISEMSRSTLYKEVVYMEKYLESNLLNSESST